MPIGIDTNVLLRYVMQDDERQSRLAAKLIESLDTGNPGFISLVSLAEFYWVLDHTYKLSSDQIIIALEGLVTSDSLILEDETRVQRALDLYRNGGADFDDCLIAETASIAGCRTIFTFDKSTAKYGIMQLLT